MPRFIGTELVLLRHWREARKHSNTGRIARLAIPEIQIHDYGDPSVSFRHDDLGVEGSQLLMPDPSRGKPPSLEPVERLIIPNGTWGQSRRMCTRLRLNDLPKVHLPLPRADTIRLRKPPGPWAISTLCLLWRHSHWRSIRSSPVSLVNTSSHCTNDSFVPVAPSGD